MLSCNVDKYISIFPLLFLFFTFSWTIIFPIPPSSLSVLSLILTFHNEFFENFRRVKGNEARDIGKPLL